MEEYAASLPFDLGFQSFYRELNSLPGDYFCILLAFSGEEAAGCVALRPCSADIAEMKRLYVKPGFLGKGLGCALVEAALSRATQKGFKRVRLDTTPGMIAAIQIYRKFGFTQIPPYRENPVPGASYWEKILSI